MRSAGEIANAVRAGEVSAESVVRESLDSIAARDGELRAFLQVFETDAVARAKAIDAMVAKGDDPGPLAGVPVAIKDNICTVLGRTTCASRMLEHYESPYDATAVTRLLDAGAVIVGKTNLDEFAMGSSCEHSAFGPTRNPWDAERVPGGSSGGSAAAVAAGMVPVALGSDTGGSVRQPAGLCGVVGVKPTYGRVSRYGLVAFASSLDQIGVFARTNADAALVLRVISGADERDATSARRDDTACDAGLGRDAAGLTLGVPSFAHDDAVSAETRAVFDATCEALRAAGVELVDVELPHASHGVAAYYIVAPAEASSNLARYDGVRYGRRAEGVNSLDEMYTRTRSEGFGHEVQRRIMLGTHVLSSGYHDAYYVNALRVRRRIKQDYDAVFARGIDAVLTPTSPSPAFGVGEKLDDPMALYVEDLFTVGANLAGLPAVSVPAGFADPKRQEGVGEGEDPSPRPSPPGGEGGRLPVGVHLVGHAWGEAALLGAASVVERVCGVSGRVAPA
ncbi:MAG: Asp-tRNA(Asn)/Glu-tRNA(Gln) amidotransferase subunit GatA [Phycisphaerales bacterium]